MKKFNHDKRIRISFVIGFFAFFFAGLDSLEQSQLILATSNFLLAIVNILSLYFVNEKGSEVKIILLILNAFLALIVSYSYYSAGKMLLPIAWLVVGLFYFVLSLKMIGKSKRKTVSQNNNGN